MTRSRNFWIFGRGVALGFFAIRNCSAQTVDEIIKRGKVIIGVNTTTPIFGLMGKDGQPEGYDPDVARLVGKYLGVQVEFVSVTGANRIPLLLSGKRRHADLPVRHHARARAAGLVLDPLCHRSRDAGRAGQPHAQDGRRPRRACASACPAAPCRT